MSEKYYKDFEVPKTPKPGETPEPWKQTTVVGQPNIRRGGYERVAGTATFASDVRLPGMLYGAFVRCPHARARVKSVDTSAAKKMPGVWDVIDASTPEAKGRWLPSWTNSEVKVMLFDPECRYEGAPVAAVAAETPYQASDAARAVKVEYEILPFACDIEDALKPGAPIIHGTDNKIVTRKYERGDLPKGFAEADVVLEESYRMECILQNTLERHGCVATWEGDYLTCYDSTQGVYNDQGQIANCLGMPLSRVRVISPFTGGGFGSKLQINWENVCAPILSKRTGRPVKLFLTREEEYVDAGNRPPAVTTMKVGVKKDGTLTAIEFIADGTGGPFDHGGIWWHENMIKHLYLCPNLRTVVTDVATNAGLARPMRGPNYVEAAHPMEIMMDALAEKIGMCPVKLRLQNIPAVKQDEEGTPAWSSYPLKECLNEGAKVFGWTEARKRTANQKGPIRRGVGVAAINWESGNGWLPGTVIVRLFADGTANLNTGITEIGTGSVTGMALVVAEELGIKPEMIEITNGDTGTTQWSSFSAGSKTIPTESPAARDAAIKIKQQLLQMASQDLKVPVDDLIIKGGVISSATDPSKSEKITDVSGLKGQQVLVGVGIRHAQPAAPCRPICVQFCEVEVNTKTGEIKVVRYLSSNDPGRVINPLTCNNQTHGGIVQGLGLILSEGRVLDRSQTGRMLNKNMHDYKVPTILDVPLEITCIYPGGPDNILNWCGAKGWGEPPTIPTAPAVANAIYNAIGVRFTKTPITPMKLKA
jgi:xanthine dehydrogenase YagR molybdenum-binding subunit